VLPISTWACTSHLGLQLGVDAPEQGENAAIARLVSDSRVTKPIQLTQPLSCLTTSRTSVARHYGQTRVAAGVDGQGAEEFALLFLVVVPCAIAFFGDYL